MHETCAVEAKPRVEAIPHLFSLNSVGSWKERTILLLLRVAYGEGDAGSGGDAPISSLLESEREMCFTFAWCSGQFALECL